MGMAASQARLLCITARIHDVEYQAQAIQNAKLQLATQSDQIYQDYVNALDASTLTLNSINTTSSETSIVSATFNNLCSVKKLQASDGSVYSLRDKNGRLVVEDDVYEGYNEFIDMGLNDPYLFAIYMHNGRNIQELAPGNEGAENGSTFLEEAQINEEEAYTSLSETDKTSRLTNAHDKLQEIVEKATEALSAEDKNIGTKGNSIYNREAIMMMNDEDLLKLYDDTMQIYREELYRTHAPEVLTAIAGTSDDIHGGDNYNQTAFTHYLSLFKQIQQCGGCVSIEFYDGPEGDAASNSEWLKNMIQCGELSIQTVSTDSKTGVVSFESTLPSSDSCLSYTATSTIDKTALAKAEAKYDKDMKDLNQKDKQHDLTLSKLETERTALTTEYESVKKVIQENIERTFGIFS